MADAVPNPVVEMQRVRMNIANLKATIERQKFEMIEMEDRKARNLENIAGSEKHIKELEGNLRSMEKAHEEKSNG